MSNANGGELRRRREALGLTLDQLADVTAVPADYLRALEDGAHHQLPPGPYAAMYTASVRRALDRYEASDGVDGGPRTQPSFVSEPGLYGAERRTGPVPTADGLDGDLPSEAVVHTRPIPAGDDPPTGVPLRVVRMLALGSTTLLLLLLIWQGTVTYKQFQARADPGPREPITVKVKLRNNAQLRVSVDGALVAHRQFAGKDVVEWTAQDRIEVEVPSLNAAWVWFEGRSISPRGFVDRPRTLVFVNDRRAP